MESKDFKYARLLGFDFIKGKDGQLWLIEVNDTPAHLSTYDSLSSAGGGTINPNGQSAIEKIASVLSSSNEDGVAVILRTLSSNAQGENEDESDFAAIIKRVNSLGRECLVITPSDLDKSNGLSLRDGRKIISAYRRTHVRADCAPRQSTINPAIAAAICRDKLLSYSVLSTGAQVQSIPTSDCPSLTESFQESKFFIKKPRFGSASRGVSRLEAPQMCAQVKEEDYVWQPWIEPNVTEINGKPYYYDMRVISFDGEVVGAYARCAAAPVGGVATNHELEWLTTLGRVLPICVGDKCEYANSVMLTNVDARLIKQAAYECSRIIENALIEKVNSSPGNNLFIAPEDRSTPILYVCSGGKESESAASRDAILATRSLLPSPIICDVSTLEGDWGELVLASGWALMPQLFVKNEFFVGSQVIEEAVRSGEINRALTNVAPAWESEVVVNNLPALSGIKHGAAVWALCSTPKGEVKVSAAADGTIRIDTENKALLYFVDSCWLNSISISPCGQNLVVGTSKADVFAISLKHGSIEKALRLKGHQRWVNGVLALDDHHVVSASSDGTIALWKEGVVEKVVIRKCLGGHILGMAKSHQADSAIVWSSDGVISEFCCRSLTKKYEWRAPTKKYVTAACEAFIDGKWGFYAVDINGVVFSSLQSRPVFSVNCRAWGMTADIARQRISLVTVDGHLFSWCGDYDYPERTPLDCDAPTVCRYTPNGSSLMIGFAGGSVCLC